MTSNIDSGIAPAAVQNTTDFDVEAFINERAATLGADTFFGTEFALQLVSRAEDPAPIDRGGEVALLSDTPIERDVASRSDTPTPESDAAILMDESSIPADHFNRIVDEAQNLEVRAPVVLGDESPAADPEPSRAAPNATGEIAELKNLIVRLMSNVGIAAGTPEASSSAKTTSKRTAAKARAPRKQQTGSSTPKRTSGSKRKHVASEAVNLWSFVETLARNYDRVGDGQSPQRDAEFKRAKLDTPNDAPRKDPEIVLRAFAACTQMYESSAGATFQFSREHLKFFMATYTKFIRPADFVFKFGGTVTTPESAAAATAATGAASTATPRRPKTQSQLAMGGILVEYAKGPDNFIANVGRADKLDVEALKLLFRHGLTLPERIYRELTVDQIRVPTYEHSSAESLARQPFHDGEFVRIPVSSTHKRAIVFASGNVMLCYTRDHIGLPAQTFERDFGGETMRRVAEFGGVAPYVVFEVLLPSNRILDLVDCRLPNENLPASYSDRLAKVHDWFPALECVSIACQGNDESVSIRPQPRSCDEIITSSYIRKRLIGAPNLSAEPTLTYLRPNPTALVVAVQGKVAHIAFRSDDSPDSLVVQTHCDIAGPMAMRIMCAESADDDTRFVHYAGTRFAVENVPEDARCLRHGVVVEVREGDKLGSGEATTISTLGEYLTPTTAPVTATASVAAGSRQSNSSPMGAVASAVAHANKDINIDDPEQLVELILKSNNLNVILARLLSQKNEIVLPVDQYETS